MNWVSSAILWIVYIISLYFSVFWLLVFLEKDARDKRVPRLGKYPLVTVAVPAYNEQANIKRTLNSVLALRYPKSALDVIVVDDGSTDKTAQVARDFAQENQSLAVRVIRQQNKGKGAALNAALKVAKGEFFVVFDADSQVERTALVRMLPHFETPDIAAVLPMMKVRKPKNLLERMQWYEYLLNMFYKKLMGKLDCVHVAPGPFSVYRADVLRRVGCFDENHNLTEDLEITLRLQKNRYRIIQLMDVVATTKVPATMRSLFNQRNRWFKGATLNAWKYRAMLLNRKYGDFGMIQMPTILVSGILAVTIVTSTMYYMLKPYVLYFYRMSFVNFDFWTMLYDLTFNVHLLDFKYSVIVTGLLMSALSLFVLVKAHRYANERVLAQGWFPLVVFIFFYYLLLGAVWVTVTIDLLRGKKQRW